jgi:hypothetical protein
MGEKKSSINKQKQKKEKLRKQPHNFREFFTLVKNETNKSNAKAVCICCSNKNGGLQAAQNIPGCFTSNRARLCRAHLANCDNFKNAYTEEEVRHILSRSVSEDNKQYNNDGDMEGKYFTITKNIYLKLLNILYS